MADFKPAAYREYVYDNEGTAHRLVGWKSHSDWASMEPVVPNPDGGPRVAAWSVYHGDDPWFFALA